MPDVTPLRDGDPEVLGRYRIEGRLGEGGQGVVFLGRGPDETPVAVKVLRSDLAANAAVRARFAREVTAAQRVAAQFCVAQVIEADLAADPPYVVTEFVDGPTLGQSVRDGGPRSGAGLHRLAVTTATALAAIHQAGVAHRDFKPANVLLGSDGPRVIDFGIARSLDVAATQTGGIVGTPSYMAPEQFSGGAGTPADVFAWGCVMVFAANGRPPFGGGEIPVLINQILHQEPDLGVLVPPLRDIVQAGLRKDPAARPTMQQILMRLLGKPSEFPAAPPPLPPGFPSVPTAGPPPAHLAATMEPASRRRPWPWLAGAGGVIAVIAIVLLAQLWPFSDESKKKQPEPTPSLNAAPVGGPTRTPRLGLEFWQGTAAAPLTFKSDGGKDIVTVTLKSAPFQLRYPKQAGEQALKICAWTDASVFTERTGQVAKNDSCFGEYRGLADYEFGSGTLMLDNQGFNYLMGKRVQTLSADTNKVDYAQTLHQKVSAPLQQRRGELFLAFYMPQAKDGKFHITGPAELEYVVLRFSG
ncbi:serine/threonine-protein kinase [Spirillospora sp. CA-294931]|uniref:serine/threonine-protein kinase n=1 Tax=Spirillospora sp. CA-294931 TaxID=3240042 RepID=UPI003D8FF97D